MPISYPEGLPPGLRSGRSYQLVSPLLRSDLQSGRARQRRKFSNVPQGAQISWLFNSAQASVFEAWWRYTLQDGSLWFDMPLRTPLGLDELTCRFTGVYTGPSFSGPDLWSVSAELELKERAVLTEDMAEWPEYVLGASIIDRALNQLWPLNPWQAHIEVADIAINEDWPLP